eukprot:TRINITY_DN9047_c0_g1_i1.p1 TRINITY_DN9047_c0_g1~~TRINITY_DN9047_c0_g1_i1.p1  ORF type:complete len:1318 (+),score=139.79 TRINITY_DN9047_c0_g1_i1:24-3956(+)
MFLLLWACCALAKSPASPGEGQIEVPEGFKAYGDMVVPENFTSLFTTTVIPHPKSKTQPQFWTTSVSYPANIWGDGLNIPYAFDSSASSAYQTALRRAMQHISSLTCLTFQEQSSPPVEHLKLAPGSACASQVGRIPGYATTVNVNEVSCEFGSIVHEVCHGLGLMHMHSRADSQSYIYTNLDNAPTSIRAGYTLVTDNGMTLNPYDYGSIMHYSYSADGGLSTVLWAPRAIGQRHALSTLDIAELHFVYTDCQQNKPKCLQNNPDGAVLGVGQTTSFSFFYAERGSSPAATLSLSLPSGASSSVASGSQISPVAKIDISYTPQSTDSGSTVTFTASFTSKQSGQVATCSTIFKIVPYQLQLECFGILATNPSVCSGVGQCRAPDVCVCPDENAGLYCELTFPDDGLVALYNGLRVTSADSASFTTHTGTQTPLNAIEDWQLDVNEAGMLEYEVRTIGIFIGLAASASITFSFQDSSGNEFYSATQTITTSTAVVGMQDNATFSGLGSFPVKGRLQLTGTAGVEAVWRYGTAATRAGTDDTGFGTRAPKRQMFAIYGILRCKDGYYGSKCQNVCPGGAAELQCYQRGRCNDGPKGTGTCVCNPSIYDASSGCQNCLPGTACVPAPSTAPTPPTPSPAPAPSSPVPSPSPTPAPVPSPPADWPSTDTSNVYCYPTTVVVGDSTYCSITLLKSDSSWVALPDGSTLLAKINQAVLRTPFYLNGGPGTYEFVYTPTTVGSMSITGVLDGVAIKQGATVVAAASYASCGAAASDSSVCISGSLSNGVCSCSCPVGSDGQCLVQASCASSSALSLSNGVTSFSSCTATAISVTSLSASPYASVEGNSVVLQANTMTTDANGRVVVSNTDLSVAKVTINSFYAFVGKGVTRLTIQDLAINSLLELRQLPAASTSVVLTRSVDLAASNMLTASVPITSSAAWVLRSGSVVGLSADTQMTGSLTMADTTQLSIQGATLRMSGSCAGTGSLVVGDAATLAVDSSGSRLCQVVTQSQSTSSRAFSKVRPLALPPTISGCGQIGPVTLKSGGNLNVNMSCSPQMQIQGDLIVSGAAVINVLSASTSGVPLSITGALTFNAGLAVNILSFQSQPSIGNTITVATAGSHTTPPRLLATVPSADQSKFSATAAFSGSNLVITIGAPSSVFSTSPPSSSGFGGIIVGAAIGGAVLALLILVIIIYCCCCKKRKRLNNSGVDEVETVHYHNPYGKEQLPQGNWENARSDWIAADQEAPRGPNSTPMPSTSASGSSGSGGGRPSRAPWDTPTASPVPTAGAPKSAPLPSEAPRSAPARRAPQSAPAR